MLALGYSAEANDQGDDQALPVNLFQGHSDHQGVRLCPTLLHRGVNALKLFFFIAEAPL
jgi:hypothetical protein